MASKKTVERIMGIFTPSEPKPERKRKEFIPDISNLKVPTLSAQESDANAESKTAPETVRLAAEVDREEEKLRPRGTKKVLRKTARGLLTNEDDDDADVPAETQEQAVAEEPVQLIPVDNGKGTPLADLGAMLAQKAKEAQNAPEKVAVKIEESETHTVKKTITVTAEGEQEQAPVEEPGEHVRQQADEAEDERLAAEQAEADRLAAEQAKADEAEAERLKAEQAEADRLAAEKAEKRKAAAAKGAATKAAKKAAKEKADAAETELQALKDDLAKANEALANKTEQLEDANKLIQAERTRNGKLSVEHVIAELAVVENPEQAQGNAPEPVQPYRTKWPKRDPNFKVATREPLNITF